MDISIGYQITKPVTDWDAYAEVAKWCNQKGTATIEDKGTYYEVIDISLSETEQEIQDLKNERTALMAKLSSLDYIGVKIATGRATADEYTDEIALMNEYAERINEIDEGLAELGATDS